MTPDELSERLLNFAVRISKVVDALPNTKTGNHIANQLVRSGTSPGPNYEEGRAAESRKDFAHKVSISLKELRESKFWLKFIACAKLLPEKQLNDLIDKCQQLSKIIGKSIYTSKTKK